MIYEKIFKLSVGRQAKIIIRGELKGDTNSILIEMEFLIKDTPDATFRAPIGTGHPQFWKLKRYTPEKCQYLQLEYSGLSKRELLVTVDEFRALFGAGFAIKYKNLSDTRIKYLKGIRVSAPSRRML